MKKIMNLLLCVLIIIGLTACNSAIDNSTNTNTVDNEVETKDTNTQEESSAVNTDVTTTAYELTGTLNESVVIESEDDVVITLNNVNAKLEDSVIKINNAKSATLILEGNNTLESTLADTKVISSNVDLIIKGDGTLNITSADTCIKSDTNLVIESGTYNLNGGVDGDGLRSDETLTINGGSFVINSGEGIESTQITINKGNITISASDDGINASAKSETLTPEFVMNDGEVYITMAEGDTDAIDSNGNLTVNGGYIEINAQSAFDYDLNGTYNGGTIIVNGQEINSVSNQFGMSGMPGQGGQAPSGAFPNGIDQGQFSGGQGGNQGGFPGGQGGFGHGGRK